MAAKVLRGFPLGIELSVGLHILVILLVWAALHFHPRAMALPPLNNPFEHAIAVSLTPAPHPQPKPKVPAPPHIAQPTPHVVQTQAVQQAHVTPPPIAKPTPPQMPQQQAQPQEQSNPDYAQVVESILNQAKRYPREAVLSGTEGEVVVSFVLNNQGTVLGYTIEKPSGSAALDNEVRRLIHAVRFPPFPPGDHDLRKTLQVPVEFKLGQGVQP